VWDAIDAVGMREAVERLPHGLDTLAVLSALGGELSVAAGEWVDLCSATVRMSLQSGRIGSPAWHCDLFR
jgi:hypothetical protein